MRNSFTLSYSGISDRLINDIKLSNNGISLSVKALWDTGATITCISPEIAKKLRMDIINLGDFVITNKNGNTKFTFEIPSSRDIDFVKENKK